MTKLQLFLFPPLFKAKKAIFSTEPASREHETFLLHLQQHLLSQHVHGKKSSRPQPPEDIHTK